MSKDRSLDDFDDTASLDDAGDTDDSDDNDPVATDAVAPATPTYRFDPDGAACDACDEAVEKRWHDDGQFVCADCKEW